MCSIIAGLFLNFYIKTYKQGKGAVMKSDRNGVTANGVTLSDKDSNGTALTGGISSVTRRHVPTKL